MISYLSLEELGISPKFKLSFANKSKIVYQAISEKFGDRLESVFSKEVEIGNCLTEYCRDRHVMAKYIDFIGKYEDKKIKRVTVRNGASKVIRAPFMIKIGDMIEYRYLQVMQNTSKENLYDYFVTLYTISEYYDLENLEEVIGASFVVKVLKFNEERKQLDADIHLFSQKVSDLLARYSSAKKLANESEYFARWIKIVSDKNIKVKG